MGMGKEITCINIYGPYSDSLEYCVTFFNRDYTREGLVISGGDLNFFLGASEVWGPTLQVHDLSGFFINK
jgi:hypothetical protein